MTLAKLVYQKTIDKVIKIIEYRIKGLKETLDVTNQLRFYDMKNEFECLKSVVKKLK